MKSLVGKLGMLALLGAAVGVGCSSSQTPGSAKTGSEGPQGNVGLSLVPVTGVTLNTVHYVVTNSATPAVTVSEGDLPTPGTASSFSFGLSLPVTVAPIVDTISLSATSVENPNIKCAGSFGTFAVAPNAATNFTMTLTCHDTSTGEIIGGVAVATDACPRLVFDYVVATPSSANVGSTIATLTHAHDLDSKVVTYSWKLATPAVGTFAPTTGATSTLTCNAQSAVGGTLVTVTASNGECTKTLDTTISCKSLLCGNGVVDPGETCDTALTPATCPADCTFVCGDGVAEPPAEQCDPPNTAACDATCHTRGASCGDGFITAPELCDGTTFPAGTTPGSTCSADCLHIVSPVCGDGTTTGTEACDTAGASPTCSGDCSFKVSTPGCVTCENSGICAASVNNCLGPVATPFTPAQQLQCYAVMSCIEKNNCLDGTGSLGLCYCGSLPNAACSAAPFTGPGSPDGICVNEIKAGMPGVTANSVVLASLTATSLPAGAGMQRLNCQKTANAARCLTPCGLAAGSAPFPGAFP